LLPPHPSTGILAGVTAPSYRLQPPKFLAGALCLDFINTVSWRGDRDDPGERLTSYAELLHWAVRARVLDASGSRRLTRSAERRPADALAVVDRAVEFREALARLILAGKRATSADLAVVNAMLASAPARSAILVGVRGYAWTDGSSDDELESPLRSVIWSAADLLTSENLSRVRHCADARCRWYFLDASPSGKRRWCSMQECGNRAKVRRHYKANKT
jgi:predicted RNA-binding Zn ribbon-like protein